MPANSFPVDIKFKAIDKFSAKVDQMAAKFPGLAKNIKRANVAFQQLDRQSKSIASNFDRVGKNIANTGKSLSTKLTLPLSALGALSFSTFKDLDQQMIEVRKTTGLSLDEIKSSVFSLSDSLPIATSKLLEIAGAAGQLGVKGTADIEKFTSTFAKIEQASDVAGEEGARSVVRLLNVVGDGVGKIDQFGSALIALGNNSAATEGEILEVATRVGLATAQFKLGSSATLGIATAMKSLGVQAEAGGTVIGQTFQAIDDAIAKGGDSFKRLEVVTGLTGDALKQEFQKNAGGVFAKFVAGLARMEKKGIRTNDALKSFGLQGIRVSAVMNTLVQRSEVLGDKLNMSAEAFANNTALEEEFKSASESVNAQLQQQINKFTKAAFVIGEKLKPAIVSVVAFAARLAEKFSNLSPAIQTTIVVAGSLAAALGPILAGIGFMVQGIGVIIPLLAKLKFAFVAIKAIATVVGGVIAGVSAPIWGVVAAVGALVAGLTRAYYAWDELKAAFSAGQGVIDTIKKVGSVFFGFGGASGESAGPSGAAVGGQAVAAQAGGVTNTNNARVDVNFNNAPAGTTIRSTPGEGPLNLRQGFQGAIQ